jgi:hypothetical protein
MEQHQQGFAAYGPENCVDGTNSNWTARPYDWAPGHCGAGARNISQGSTLSNQSWRGGPATAHSVEHGAPVTLSLPTNLGCAPTKKNSYTNLAASCVFANKQNQFIQSIEQGTVPVSYWKTAETLSRINQQ